MTDEEIGAMETSNSRYFYITKGSYYRPGAAGYTDFRTMAGIFTKDDAIGHAMKSHELTIIPVDEYEHNLAIRLAIEELTTRIIKLDVTCDTFMDDCRTGKACAEQVYEYMNEWLTGNYKRPVHEFLGLSFEEYIVFSDSDFNHKTDVIKKAIVDRDVKVMEKIMDYRNDKL